MGQRSPQCYELSGTHLNFSNGYKNLFYFFKPIIPLFLNSLYSGLVKLGPRMTWSWEKGAQELHVFAHNQDHVHNSQIDIQIWFLICKRRMLLFKNHLHSGLTKIKPKTIRIWSKWAEECLNIARAQEPTYISEIVSKKYFIFLNHNSTSSK